MNFIGLITRCKNEPYIEEFTKYYINQGVDMIYIIDDNSNKNIYKNLLNNKKITIIFNKKYHINHNIILNENHNSPLWKYKCEEYKGCRDLYYKIKNNYEWIITVDVDEFITTKKSPDKTIKQELETTFKNAHCVKIPWVMMSSNYIRNNPISLLETNVYRWNHNKRHISSLSKFRCRYNSIEVKCIFKPKYFNSITMHHPLRPTLFNINIVDSINNKKQILSTTYNNLRESDIKTGYLLCYHYRIISVQDIIRKIKQFPFYNMYSVKQLLSNDYPELIDLTLKNKVIK